VTVLSNQSAAYYLERFASASLPYIYSDGKLNLSSPRGVLTEYRLGYGFILLCHKLRDLSSHREGASRTSTFLMGAQPGNFELIMLAASLAASICIFAGLWKDNVSLLSVIAKSSRTSSAIC